MKCTGHIIFMVVGGDRKIMREEGNCVCNSFLSGGRYIGFMATVVVRAITKAPSIHPMLGPRFPLLRGFINKSLNTRWGDGGGIVIKRAIHMGES